jgi:hypothetical protein
VSERRSLPPVVIDRQSAREITCQSLHNHIAKRANGTDISISIQPLSNYDDGSGALGQLIPVPPDTRLLSTLFSDVYDGCRVLAKYTPVSLQGLDPAVAMTRLDFVMETLNIWERKAGRLVHPHSQLKRDEYLLVMEILKKTYSLEELMPPGLDMAEFNNYFKEENLNANN